MKDGNGKKVVLAYSGGLDTSICVRWLVDRGYEVVCFMADVGQGGDYKALTKRALGAGATDVIVHDLKKEFADEYVWPSLKANALYENQYPLATSLSRPVIAKHLVEVAHKVGATAVGHGCTAKGNDQVRFELTVRMFDPKLEIIAPVREWEFDSREAQIDYAKKHQIPVDVTKKKIYSIDENIWGISIEGGVMEDPWVAPPADTYITVTPIEKVTAKPREISIEFKEGIPIKVDDKAYKSVELIEYLGKLAGKYGIGRVDMIESRVVGIKSREVYEAPAGFVLLEAHEELERLVLDGELLRLKQQLAVTYADLVYKGLWFTPMREALDAFINSTQRKVTGSVKLRLSSGLVQVIGRKSKHALYQENLATYSTGDKYDHSMATGFMHLMGLPYEGAAKHLLKKGK